MALSIFKVIEEHRANGVHCALCIIFSTQGSTPLKAGAKMVVTEDGKIFGTIGGGNLEKKVIEDALEMIGKNECRQFEHHLLQEHGMCCGGTVNVYIESISPPEKLYIFGAGHVSRALSSYASTLPFEVTVIDSREEELDKIENSCIHKVLIDYTDFLPQLPFDNRTFIAIMTYDHKIDREILAYCINKPFAYLGMIGSQRKVAVTRKMFLNAGHSTEDELSKVDMPMGFDIAGVGPEEIAISILAKIIEVKNKKNIKTKVGKRVVSHFKTALAECGF